MRLDGSGRWEPSMIREGSDWSCSPRAIGMERRNFFFLFGSLLAECDFDDLFMLSLWLAFYFCNPTFIMIIGQ